MAGGSGPLPALCDHGGERLRFRAVPAPNAAPKRSPLLASVVLHAAVVLVARAVPVRTAPARPERAAERVEFEFTEAPASEPLAATEPAPAAASPAPGAARAPRATRPRAVAPAPIAAAPSVPAAPSAPRGPAPVAPAPRIDANEVLRQSGTSAFNAWSRGAVVLTAVGNGHGARDLIATAPGTVDDRVFRASAGYVRDQLGATHQHEAPGVRAYLWSLRRRMIETWRPGVAREPTMLSALVAGVAMPAEAMRDVLRSAAGAAVEPGRAGSAADALDGVSAAGSNNPAARNIAPFTGIVDASRGNTQRTRAEVEVVQDATGRVLSVRVLRGSRVAGFDDAALRAVREALPLQESVPMPGGRRSRWSFEVIASRDPFVPGVGFAFDESSGWFELHYPGRLHMRSRVWLEGAAPVDG